MKKRYRTRYENGHRGHVYETLPEAIAAVALGNECAEFSEVEGGRLRFHLGPLTLGHIEPCESGGN